MLFEIPAVSHIPDGGGGEQWAQERIARLLITLAANREAADIIAPQVSEGLPSVVALLDGRNARLAQVGLSFLSTVVELPGDLREKCAPSGLIEAAVGLLGTKEERLRMQALSFIAKMAGHGAFDAQGAVIVRVPCNFRNHRTRTSDLMMMMLMYVTRDTESNGMVLINCGGVREMVSLLACPELPVRTAAIGALAALSATGSERVAAAVAAVGGIGALVPLLASSHPPVPRSTPQRAFFRRLTANDE